MTWKNFKKEILYQAGRTLFTGAKKKGNLDKQMAQPIEQLLSLPKHAYVKIEARYSHLVSEVETMEYCNRTEESTRGQRNCPEWYEKRKGRLTASNFKSVCKRKKTPTEEFRKSSLNYNKSLYTGPIRYGRSTECKAKELYTERTGRKIHPCGLVINPEFPFLAASPDGKIIDKGKVGLIEVKCPYVFRDERLEVAVRDKTFCLEKNGDTYSLKRSHSYYYQVQGQLMISGVDFLDFIVYTRIDIKIIRIEKNIQFMESFLMPPLCKFYNLHRI